MASLTGQIISQTYTGLLHLSDVSTGATSDFQIIADGAGDNTALRIGTGGFKAPNQLYLMPMKGKYYGPGLAGGTAGMGTNTTFNCIVAQLFFDLGQYSYSAMSFTIDTASAVDSIEFALYNTQMSNEGLLPYQPLVSGLTANTTTTGLKTIVFPQNISFSGSPGPNFLVFKISSTGSTISLRWPSVARNILAFGEMVADYGGFASGGKEYCVWKSANGNIAIYGTQTTFDNPFTSTLVSKFSDINSYAGFGFILHTA